MYCKNCGKKLPDDARFCDRCNMSVRKMGNKMDLIEELKEERLARKKEQEVKERFKSIKKTKRRRRSKAVIAVILVLALGIVSGVAMYIHYMNTSDLNRPAAGVTAAPTATAASIPVQTVRVIDGNSTPSPQITPASGTAAVSPNEDGYIETTVEGAAFAYPRGYERRNNSSDVLLSLRDSDSEAVITVDAEDTEESAKDLMRGYADRNSGTVAESLAGDDWYSITISNGSENYHRCGIVRAGKHIYYEMRYPTASEKEGEYREDIQYMDDHFKEG